MHVPTRMMLCKPSGEQKHWRYFWLLGSTIHWSPKALGGKHKSARVRGVRRILSGLPQFDSSRGKPRPECPSRPSRLAPSPLAPSRPCASHSRCRAARLHRHLHRHGRRKLGLRPGLCAGRGPFDFALGGGQVIKGW